MHFIEVIYYTVCERTQKHFLSNIYMEEYRMYKKVTLLLAILVMASILISACQPAAAPVVEKLKVCQVTDTGGIDDKSFNATAWLGMQKAETDLGVEVSYVEISTTIRLRSKFKYLR